MMWSEKPARCRRYGVWNSWREGSGMYTNSPEKIRGLIFGGWFVMIAGVSMGGSGWVLGVPILVRPLTGCWIFC